MFEVHARQSPEVVEYEDEAALRTMLLRELRHRYGARPIPPHLLRNLHLVLARFRRWQRHAGRLPVTPGG